MVLRWSAPLALAFWLVSLLVGPMEAAVPQPVERDPSCARGLAQRIEVVQVLGCDARGRGRVVLAFGDPGTARHVAVLVPGSDTDLSHLDGAVGPEDGPLAWARTLSAEAGDDLAAILWVGYATPRGLGPDVATGRLARAGAVALARFVDQLDGDSHVTVIGHSYGAVVVALAARDLRADDIVLLGSPGARADSAAGLGASGRVWAARCDGDWIRLVPKLRIGDLGHGPDPADPTFGARPLPVAGVTGHDGYFRAGSRLLAALVSVSQGSSPSWSPDIR